VANKKERGFLARAPVKRGSMLRRNILDFFTASGNTANPVEGGWADVRVKVPQCPWLDKPDSAGFAG